MPDDHSEVVPLLPIPNRTVKRLCADDSAGSRVKVGHCQANYEARARSMTGPFCFVATIPTVAAFCDIRASSRLTQARWRRAAVASGREAGRGVSVSSALSCMGVLIPDICANIAIQRSDGPVHSVSRPACKPVQ